MDKEVKRQIDLLLDELNTLKVMKEFNVSYEEDKKKVIKKINSLMKGTGEHEKNAL
jgi:hypothetical protein